jgi:predicted component of type VI protein secretion system
VEQVLANFEPRIDVDAVQIALREELNSVDIKIYYRVLNTSALQVFDIILERTR